MGMELWEMELKEEKKKKRFIRSSKGNGFSVQDQVHFGFIIGAGYTRFAWYVSWYALFYGWVVLIVS
jgi:hypothetical protein